MVSAVTAMKSVDEFFHQYGGGTNVFANGMFAVFILFLIKIKIFDLFSLKLKIQVGSILDRIICTLNRVEAGM